MARNRLTHPAVLGKLAKDADQSVRTTALRHPRVPHQQIINAARDEDQVLRKAAAANPLCPPQQFWVLATGSLPPVRRAAAGNPALPQAVAFLLAGDVMAAVRAALGGNRPVPVPVLAALAADAQVTVRRRVAFNDAVPPGVLARLAADTDPAVRAAVARNPAAGAEAHRNLLADPAPVVVQALALGSRHEDVLADLADAWPGGEGCGRGHPTRYDRPIQDQRIVLVDMSATSGKPPRTPVISCVIATTPWSGSMLLAHALRATRLVGDPRDYFNPFDVVPRCQEWGFLGLGVYSLPRIPEAEFVTRYLSAVTKAAMGRNGVLSFNLPWSHQRWLVRFARAAMPDPPGEVPRSDAKVLESWYPGTRYLYLTCADMAWQAARWYLGRTGPAALGGAPVPGQPPDFQEVRWIETLIARQEQAWECYFEVHGIDTLRSSTRRSRKTRRRPYGEFSSGWSCPARPRVNGMADCPGLHPQAPVEWLPDYQAERDRLPAAIGVRKERS